MCSYLEFYIGCGHLVKSRREKAPFLSRLKAGVPWREVYGLAREMIAVWRRAAGLLLYGDYYEHTPFHRSAEGWVAWQFDCPETGRGLVQGIRFPASSDETLTVHPEGIRAAATYRFEQAETGEIRVMAGEDLLQRGFTLALAARSGAIWFYQRAEPPAVG